MLLSNNLHANRIIKGSYFLINYTLTKLLNRNGKGWVKKLPVVLLADRTSVRNSLSRSAFNVVYGYEPVLPIEVAIPTWRILAWDGVETDEDLVKLRVRMLERREEDIREAALQVAAYRKRIKARFDQANAAKMRRTELQVGDLVLLYDSTGDTDMSTTRKHMWRWKGPFRLAKVNANRSYELETLSGFPINGTHPPFRVKGFYRDEHGWWTPLDGEELLPEDEETESETSERQDSDAGGEEHGSDMENETDHGSSVGKEEWELVDGPVEGRPIEVVLQQPSA